MGHCRREGLCNRFDVIYHDALRSTVGVVVGVGRGGGVRLEDGSMMSSEEKNSAENNGNRGLGGLLMGGPLSTETMPRWLASLLS